MPSNHDSPGGESPRSSDRDSARKPACDEYKVTRTAEDRLFILDLLDRSGMKPPQFCRYVRVTPQMIYAWRRLLDKEGVAGLEPKPKGSPGGSRLPDATRRAIIMTKRLHEDWGLDRIHQMMLRTQGFKASPTAIRRVLVEEGYELEYAPTNRRPDKVRRFERARPNQLWQSDLFTFTLHRTSRKVHAVVFLDDNSRFIVGHGLTVSASSKFVQDVFLTAVTNFGPPEEVLTDRGPQYNTWRGKSGFTKLLEKLSIEHILARPRHPQTVGKTERFWKTMNKEALGGMAPRDLDDAKLRIDNFIAFYNFRRTHQGIEGLIPADRFFDAKSEVKASMDARVAANALEIAKHGTPRKSFYLTGRVGDQSVSLHAEGEKVVMTKEDGTREEVDLSATGRREEMAESEPESGNPDPADEKEDR